MSEETGGEQLPKPTAGRLAAVAAAMVAECEAEPRPDVCPITQARLEMRPDLVQIVTSCARCGARKTIDCDPMAAE